MNTEVQFVGLKHIDAVDALVREKIDKLGRKYNWITNAAVFFKNEPDDNERTRICEIRLSVPGPQLFASQNEESYEKAVHGVIKQMEVQLEKHKSKLHQH